MTRSNRVLSINSVNYGSTGTIMLEISKVASNNGYESYISYPASKSNYRKKNEKDLIISNRLERNFHLKVAYNTGMNGCYSKYGTKHFLSKITEINPDIIHLHNLHNCYLNLEMLFNYLKSQSIPIVWTLHDCWAFTGQCPHYTFVQCDKWRKGCHTCPQYNEYPAARVDKTKYMYKLKKEWFTGIDNLTIITPSEWLKSQVKESFLKDYPVKVVNNGIDLSVFKPSETGFRKKYELEDKIVLLGVANPWSKRKGLDIFVELSKNLSDEYKIVLVGLNDKQLIQFPENILGFSRTHNQRELAKIYADADYFINPSLEETMGLVTLEAIACGTPVIVSDSTAVPEIVCEECGVIVKEYSVEGFIDGLKRLEKMNIDKKNLIDYSSKFCSERKFNEYISIYDKILKNES